MTRWTITQNFKYQIFWSHICDKIIIRTIKCAYIINPHVWQPYQVKEIMGKADLSILKKKYIYILPHTGKKDWVDLKLCTS